MLGTKIYKPVETQEQCDRYSQVAEWCNNNDCCIEDKGEYYEVCQNEPFIVPVSDEPTIADLVEALEILTGIVLGGE